MFSALLFLALGADAHGASSTTGSSTDSGMMTALHFTPLGDTLWFAGWAPQSGGALAGACIGLFILALFDQWVASCRKTLEAHWSLQVRHASANRKNHLQMQAPPFIPAHDVPRGALYALQALLGFAVMLVIMTFQVAYIISVVAGFGVGEMLFGRYGGAMAGTR